MTSQRRIQWKYVGVLLTLAVTIYYMVTCVHRPTTSGRSNVTCHHLENIFTPTDITIMEPDLPDVTPIFPNTKITECMQTVKWKFVEKFSKEEESGFEHCIWKNAYPEGLFRFYLELLNKNITSDFFSFLKAKPDVVIVEVGGYTGHLLQKLIPISGARTYAVLEPVPSFYDKLNTNIKMRNLNSVVKTYNFGLGKTYKEISVDIRGDGTSESLFQISPSKKTETIKIVNVVDFFVQIGVGCNTVDLLTINCEGCEFDILETLLSTTLIEKFNHVQFQSHHAVPIPGNYVCRYCRLRQLLARTHMVEYEYPHIWEAWRRRQ